MGSLAALSLSVSPFERILLSVYPRELLTLSLPTFLSMDKSRLRRKLLPGTHLIPYGRREELARSFISRINPSLDIGEEDIFPLLEDILYVILSKDRLIQVGSRAVLWQRVDEEFIIYTPLSKDILSTLEEVLQTIFQGSNNQVKEVDYHVFPSTHRRILETMAEENASLIQKIINLLLEKSDYEITYRAREFSFFPLNRIVNGWVILTKYGLYILGDERRRKLWIAFRLEDIRLVLAVEAMNIDHTSLLEEEGLN